MTSGFDQLPPRHDAIPPLRRLPPLTQASPHLPFGGCEQPSAHGDLGQKGGTPKEPKRLTRVSQKCQKCLGNPRKNSFCPFVFLARGREKNCSIPPHTQLTSIRPRPHTPARACARVRESAREGCGQKEVSRRRSGPRGRGPPAGSPSPSVCPCRFRWPRGWVVARLLGPLADWPSLPFPVLCSVRSPPCCVVIAVCSSKPRPRSHSPRGGQTRPVSREGLVSAARGLPCRDTANRMRWPSWQSSPSSLRTGGVGSTSPAETHRYFPPEVAPTPSGNSRAGHESLFFASTTFFRGGVS